MSGFVLLTILAHCISALARPHVVSYSPYYDTYITPYEYDYGYNSYPFTPVTYVESIPVTTVISEPPPSAVSPVLPAKIIGKNSAQAEVPALAAAAPAPPPAAPPVGPPAAPPAAPAPALITITKSFPDPSKLLASLPIAQLLELPPVKKLVALKTNKLETIMGLHSALQQKLAPIAALLP